jgi:hypothetical protein
VIYQSTPLDPGDLRRVALWTCGWDRLAQPTNTSKSQRRAASRTGCFAKRPRLCWQRLAASGTAIVHSKSQSTPEVFGAQRLG